MDKIQSAEELKSLVTQCKKDGKNKYSNYFPNPLAHSSWIENNKLECLSLPDTTFLIHDRGAYREIIFFSKSRKDFEDGIEAVRNTVKRPFSVEIIGKNGAEYSTNATAVLRRMTRVGITPQKQISSSVRKAVASDIEALHDIFATSFHPVLERVPDVKELAQLVDTGCISVYETSDGGIGGMVVYEVSGISIHLRYWWVRSDCRNQGVGSALLSEYFKAGKNTKRQYLWVFTDNENAIKRYRHYGFEFDGMTDEILLFE